MFRSQLTLTLRGVVLIAALVLSLHGEALAQQNPYSANYVMPGCRDFMKGVSLNSFKRGWCGGLITGLAQMHRRCAVWLIDKALAPIKPKPPPSD